MHFHLYLKIGHLSIKVTRKAFFVKIEVCGKNVRFVNISENTGKNSLIIRTDFIFALISRHFISLSRYFRLWMAMHQIKELKEIQGKLEQNKVILNWSFLKLFYTTILIWCIFVHNLIYVDKLFKCLEFRASVKENISFLIWYK